MRKNDLLKVVFVICLLAGCSQPPKKVRVIEYSPPNWTLNTQGFRDIGCEGKLKETCAEIIALGCDEISGPLFQFGGLRPSYSVMECIHENTEPPNKAYFRQKPGLDPRYRSYIVFQDGRYRLIIKKSEFKSIFAPVESIDEAISYAMVMTSLSSRYDIDPQANVDYLVDAIEETHAEETSDGYIVYLFDGDQKMGCGIHTNYAVKVLVTRNGEVQELERHEIFRQQVCVDFGVFPLEDN